MLFHSAEDPRLAEMAFRVVQNSAPLSATLTAASIAVGAPVVLELAAASLPNSDVAANQNFVTKPSSVATAPGNNLFIGALARVPGTKTYLAQDAIGLVQIYGPMLNALVRRDAAALAAGTYLIPTDNGFVSAGTAGPAAGLAGMVTLMEVVASSASAELATARVFLRCM
jgi:hypothetical protein